MTSQYARNRETERECTLCGGEAVRSATFGGRWMNLCRICYDDLSESERNSDMKHT